MTQALVSDMLELADVVDSGKDGDPEVEVGACLRRECARVRLRRVHVQRGALIRALTPRTGS